MVFDSGLVGQTPVCEFDVDIVSPKSAQSKSRLRLRLRLRLGSGLQSSCVEVDR